MFASVSGSNLNTLFKSATSSSNVQNSVAFPITSYTTIKRCGISKNDLFLYFYSARIHIK